MHNFRFREVSYIKTAEFLQLVCGMKPLEQLKFMAEKCSLFRQQRAAVLFQRSFCQYDRFLKKSHYYFPLFIFMIVSRAQVDCRCPLSLPCNVSAFQSFGNPPFMSEHNPLPSVCHLKKHLSCGSLFILFSFFLSVQVLRSSSISLPGDLTSIYRVREQII